ncbi:MAG: dodecin family protein [bacterium]|jgi:flavin-binding protein dodecin|nr:dodecin family protein [bacterium]MDD3806228.1 dodecin family protein [bacterium]MDD4153016.1 dodecin family protein [bacterium]MDD4558262.1 dodecin family protein [bacterium]
MAVLKTIMLTGVSEQGWEEAARTALEEAAETIEGIEWMDIKRYSARIEDNRIKEYRAVVKVTFKVERHKH